MINSRTGPIADHTVVGPRAVVDVVVSELLRTFEERFECVSAG